MARCRASSFDSLVLATVAGPWGLRPACCLLRATSCRSVIHGLLEAKVPLLNGRSCLLQHAVRQNPGLLKLQLVFRHTWHCLYQLALLLDDSKCTGLLQVQCNVNSAWSAAIEQCNYTMAAS